MVNSLLVLLCFAYVHAVFVPRGGVLPGSSPYERNPFYVPPPHLARRIELQQTPPPPPPNLPPNYFTVETQTYAFNNEEETSKSLPSVIRKALMDLPPSLRHTVLSCVAVFILWQIPACKGTLYHHFVCRFENLRSGRIDSLVLSAISHSGLFHMAFNLLALVSLGPPVKQMLGQPMWPLLLGASLSGSITFLLFDKIRNGCMGLSGVTLALLSVYARLLPRKSLGILVAGIIPVRLPAMHILQILLVWSFFGSFVQSPVAHAAHLGGLLFGLVYFEAWTRRGKLARYKRQFKRQLHKILSR
jgi:membrane associated rhomboid family serine protease